MNTLLKETTTLPNRKAEDLTISDFIEQYRENRKNALKHLFVDTEVSPAAYATCPFPQWKEYGELWAKLSPEQKVIMERNIGKKNADGSVDILAMNRKVSVLTMAPDGKQSIDGTHKDKRGNTGVEGVQYSTVWAAEKAAKSQMKKFMQDKTEILKFIDIFPGTTMKDKIFAMVKILGLKKSGYYSKGMWRDPNSVGCIRLSGVVGANQVYEVSRYQNNVSIHLDDEDTLAPILAYEPL